MPALSFTLISVGRIEDAGYWSMFGGGMCQIKAGDGMLIGNVPKSGGVYKVPHEPHVAAAMVRVKHMTIQELLNHLGHIAPHAVKDLISQGIVKGVILTDNDVDFVCHPCIIGTKHRHPIPKVREGERAKEFSVEIHLDLGGPAQKETLGKCRYYVTFTDDWLRWTMIYLLLEKSETFEVYKLFHAWVLNQLGKWINCLHTDCGGEYLSNKFNSFLNENSVERKLTVHDTPKENGVAERLNCMLQEKVRTMIYAAKLPEGLWGEALMHAAWLKNCTWTHSLPKGLTPYEMVTGETPVLCDVPEWDAIVWAHDMSNRKLHEHAKEGHWVRYDKQQGTQNLLVQKEKRNLTFMREAVQDLPDNEYFALDEPRESNDQDVKGLTQDNQVTDADTTADTVWAKTR